MDPTSPYAFIAALVAFAAIATSWNSLTQSRYFKLDRLTKSDNKFDQTKMEYIEWGDYNPIAGKQYEFNTEVTSIGRIIFDSKGKTGRYICEADKVDTRIININVSHPRKLGTSEITFDRVGDDWPQRYIGWLSKNRKIIAGYLIEMNKNIPTDEEIPFFMKEII